MCIRDRASRVAYCRIDNDSRLRRALLHRAKHHEGPFDVGSAVYYRRAQIRAGETPVHRWFGVARVVGHEGRGHGVWLRHGPSLILASPQQLRFAMEGGSLASRLHKQDFTGLDHRRAFADVRDEDPFIMAPGGHRDPRGHEAPGAPVVGGPGLSLIHI